MLKFLYWLLVPLLPFVGLLVGQCFKPERKPRWLNNYGSTIFVLGHVEEGQTLLVLEENINGEQSMSGIDTATGKTRFQLSLTTELLDAKHNQIRLAKLSSDGKRVVFVASQGSQESHQLIILFDWQKRQVAQHFKLSPNQYAISVSLNGTLLGVCGSSNLTLWNTDSPDAPNTIPWVSSPYPLQLSDDGLMVSQGHLESLGKSFESQLVLFDLKRSRKLPAIHGQLFNVIWAADAQSFTAIGYDAIRESNVRRVFIRSNDDFKEVLEQDVVLGLQGNVIADQHFSIIASTEKNNLWRIKIAKALGTSFSPILDRLWPDGQTLHLFDRSTASPVQQLKLPLGVKAFSSLKINSHPRATGVALSDARWITYWDFEPALAWQPVIGLFIGLMLAIAVAWRLLRQRPNLKQPSPIPVQ